MPDPPLAGLVERLVEEHLSHGAAQPLHDRGRDLPIPRPDVLLSDGPPVLAEQVVEDPEGIALLGPSLSKEPLHGLAIDPLEVLSPPTLGHGARGRGSLGGHVLVLPTSVRASLRVYRKA